MFVDVSRGRNRLRGLSSSAAERQTEALFDSGSNPFLGTSTCALLRSIMSASSCRSLCRMPPA